jgi:hypothetical protein
VVVLIDSPTELEKELESLGIKPKFRNELNDDKELGDLVENIKQTYYQDYKSAYSDESIDESHFDYII